MAKLLYFVLLAAVVWKAHADHDHDDEEQDFMPDAIQSNREIKCGKYYAQYPNPDDCESYIVCQNGQKTIKSCPSGQHYNFQTIRCVEPCKAYCNKTLSCECKWPTCGLDDVCFLEQIVGGCGNRVPRYFFNKRKGQCERFGYSGCMGNENNFETLEECQQKCTKAKPIPGFICLTLNGRFPNPDNCRTYFQCSDGESQLMSCESGLHYSDKSKTCEKPCDAYCDKSLSCECKWPTCGLDDRCFLPPEIGPCRAGFYNYYFNRRTGKCEEFLYGGCQGNKNNFQKKEECEKACTKTKPIPSFICLTMNGRFPNPDNCRTYFQCSDGRPQLMSCESDLHYSDKSKNCEKPCDAYCDKSLSCDCKWSTCGLKDLCFLPPEVGPCRASFYNYYFNRRTGQCEKFLYGGCQPNENNFRKKEDCEKVCTKSEEPPVDESPERTSEESAEPPADEFSDPPAEEVLDPSFECGPDGMYPHPKNCRSFVKCSKGVPTLNSCSAKLHFNNKTKKCETPCKAICDRTYACKCKWPTCGTNALCFLPAKHGLCKGKFQRFHFNKRSGECTTFEYGGCLGNENNFLTKHACESKCKHSLDICKLPYKTGPCKGKFERYYFNHKEGKCQKFTFGGCNENHNNFKTIEECETTCLQDKQKSEDFTCVKDGLFKDPESCSNYIHCVNGEKYDMPCPTGYHFNEKSELCEIPSKAQCQVPKAYSEDICRLPAETGPCIASIPKYYFNHEEGKCKIFSYGGCKGNSNNFDTREECERSCLRSAIENKVFEAAISCLQNDTLPDMNNCSQYIQCFDNGKHNIIPCPAGQHYNYALKKCKEPCEAFCDQSLACKCGWSICKDTSSEPICTEDGMYPDFESCGSYIRCSNGQRQIESCPQGLHFNKASKKCDSPCDARCDMSLVMACGWPMGAEKIADPECSEDGMFTDFSRCSHYIHCTNGEKIMKPCPPGLHFNEETKRCDSPCDAHCDQSLAFECEWPMGTALSGDNQCPENEHFSFYRAACQRNCTNYKDWIVPCHLMFRSGCVCDKGYVRNVEGNCIPTDECETLSGDNQCPENEHFSFSGAACQRNCKNYKDWFVPCHLMFRSGCVCDKGYVRNVEGNCIPTDECESENEQSEDADFECPYPDGKFPYSGNSPKYIKCTNNKATVEQCPGNQFYDFLKEECVRL